MKWITLGAVSVLSLTAGCGQSQSNPSSSGNSATGGASSAGGSGAAGATGMSGGGGASPGVGGSNQAGAAAGENSGGAAAGATSVAGATSAAGAGGGSALGPSTDVLGVGSRVCAINQARDLVCWEDSEPRTRPGPFISVSINQSAICTLLESGEATCIGPGNPPAGERFIAVRTMPTRACGQRADKTILCWGEDVFGNTSDVTKEPVSDFAVSRITCATTGGAAPTCWGPPPLAPAPTVEVTRLVGSYDFVCGIGLDTSIKCWGAEPYAPAATGFSKAAMMDYLGDAWGCALTTKNSLSCWGTPPITSEQRQGLQVADFAIAQQAICLVLTDRSIKCFGAPQPPPDLRVY